MSSFAKLRAPFRRRATDDALGTSSVPMTPVERDQKDQKDPATVGTDEATATSDEAIANNDDGVRSAEIPSEDQQWGVQDVEAVTLTWSKATLIAVFCKCVALALAADGLVRVIELTSRCFIASGCFTSSTLSSRRFSPTCSPSSRVTSSRTRC